MRSQELRKWSNTALTINTALMRRRVSRLELDELIKVYGEHIYTGLTQEKAIPVLICARNEEKSLPITLFALSQSTIPVRAIVVDNMSTDATGSIAKDLGAEVIIEKCPGLIHALIHGFTYFSTISPQPEMVLHTDADCYPLPTWAETLQERAKSNLSQKTGGQVFGPLIFYGKMMRDM